MQSDTFPGQWPADDGPSGQGDSSPPVMSATSGPVEQFFWHSHDPSSAPHDRKSPEQVRPSAAEMARSPERRLDLPDAGHHALSNAKSTPVLLPSRPPGSVKNIANKFDQAGAADMRQHQSPPQLTVRTSQERYRRPLGRTPRSPTKDGIRKLQKSPIKEDHRRLQKARSGQRSPAKSASTSFGTENSFGSTSTIMSTKSQPAAAFSPQKQVPGSFPSTQPLFGEITSDGRWNGNFDLGDYGIPPPAFTNDKRRSSEGAVALGHGRSQSHQDILQPASTTALSPPQHHMLSHKRSRSDMDGFSDRMAAASIPNIALQLPGTYPTAPQSSTRNALRKESPTSRIPVSNRRMSRDSAGSSAPHSRSVSAMSNPPGGRNRLSKSPVRKTFAHGKENTTPPAASNIPRNRYHSPASNIPNGQTLSAKIVAPLPKLSPPLRSSRPRQPVSSATTSASRARAAERFQGQAPRDGRRPSEQWLGKPYDPQKERSKRKIPELGKIDFEARRERIQKAISQNLEETRSLESLKNGNTRSRQVSNDLDAQAMAPPQEEGLNSADQRQAEVLNRETDAMPGGWPTPGALSVDTFNVASQEDREPDPYTANTADTAGTEFEIDESPVLGRPLTEERIGPSDESAQLPLLTSATYRQPPHRAPAPISTDREAAPETVVSPSVLENVLRMRQNSQSSSRDDGDYFDHGAPGSAEDSASDLEHKWGLHNGLKSMQGSIKIMLDDEAAGNSQQVNGDWSHDEIGQPQYLNEQAYASNGYTRSLGSDNAGIGEEEPVQVTPRKRPGREDTIRQADFTNSFADPAVARVLQEYQSTGSLSKDMLDEMQRHMVDLQRLSANQGSNGFMIQSLLDSIVDVQNQQDRSPEEQRKDTLVPDPYEVPRVTPDTPPGWDYNEGTGTAVVFRSDADERASEKVAVPTEEEDFYVKIRKADEAWELQQRGEYLRLDEEMDHRPQPPPKDLGYTPRSSMGPSSATSPPELTTGLRISTNGLLDISALNFGSDGAEGRDVELQQSPVSTSAPPQPSHAPPPPPSAPLTAPVTGLPFGMSDPPQMPVTYSERGSSELSPILRKSVWAQSGSSRPSIDSQRLPGPPPVPASVSMTSFTESGRKISVDTPGESSARSAKGTSPSPEHKRLLKRRNTIKELLDTEYTYHQDLKIIEDIYKATAVPDLISPEDKKVLFGNCDEVEHFSLHFYDELRKASAPVYVPAKQMRWMNKRGSYSTTQSDGTTQGSTMPSDNPDDERDKTTTVGRVFLQNLAQMEHIYSMYLKNHDAANQRLSALRNTTTVKCWLDECHNNASDITSAWDLDSLLVKPTQRIAKYPMLLTQLLDTTPESHPDRDALSAASRDMVGMLTRMNDAKKRADLVDQIVNRKRKDSDVRSGIAKAFGRRTEKLKERVGIAEAFSDPDFDHLASRWHGHYIRLQICWRDVQAYVKSTESAMQQITDYANSMEFFTDVSLSSGSELESRWRKYGQTIREITAVAFPEHKAAVTKRVIDPMYACIKLHAGPENALNNRKKRIVDYAKVKSMEKRGEKPDKKMIEASEFYVALNEQLKIELPKLYSLSASLVQRCLNCFLEIQVNWHNTWDRKLRPILDAVQIPSSVHQIEPAFLRDFEHVVDDPTRLGICNGAVLAESANFLSPTTTFEGTETPSSKRPSTLDSSKRTMSVGSDISPAQIPAYKRRSSSYAPGSSALQADLEGRFRSNSSMSNRGTPAQTPGSSATQANPLWSNGNTPTSSFSQSRPATANQSSTQQPVLLPPRISAEHTRSPRPASAATYFTARPDPATDDTRFSGIFTSAMPPPDADDASRPASPRPVTGDTPVLFVCASLFEFSIDKTRREAGYPYLTYVQGEVFDVIGQKGELWLAKNQDDSANSLGWVWEQHFVILSQD